VVVAVALAAVFAAIVLHELGHVAGGRLRGMRLVLFAAGPVLVLGRPGRRLEWRFNRILPLWGGLAAMAPATQGDFRRDMLVVAAAGPAASLVAAALAAVAGAALQAGGSAGAAGAAFILAFLCGAIGFATGLPLRAGGYLSDGAQCRELLRGGGEVLQRAAAARLFARSLAGTRPRDWPPEEVEAALAPGGPAVYATSALLLGAAHALDRGERALARERLLALAERIADIPDGFRQAAAAEIAAFLGEEGDAVGARAWAGAAKGGLVEPHQRELVRAAVAFAEGRDEDARRAAASARATLGRSWDAGAAQAALERLDALERRGAGVAQR
jgi:hypothetical protein